MKIVRLKIEGFRSLRSPQRIELKHGRSLCLLADNGRGKSSIVDALEYWSTGDVEAARREGVGLGAMVHLDAVDGATVEVKTTGGQVASRRLSGATAADLTPGEGLMQVGFSPGPLPILRNTTMAGFVNKTANEKRAALLTMLGLTRLVPFRAGLRSAASRARREAKDSEAVRDATREAWEQALDGKDPATRLSQLSGQAQLRSTLTAPEQLRDLDVGSGNVAAGPAGTRLSQAEELAAAAAALELSSVEAWNAAVADQRVAAEQGVSALLHVGQDLLAKWSDDSCPLCLVEQPRDRLVEQVRRRATALAAADKRFEAAASQAEEREQAIVRLGRAVAAVVADEGSREWPHLAEAQALLEDLREEIVDVRRVRAVRGTLAQTSPGPSGEMVEALRQSALRAPGETGPALLALAQLRSALQARTEAEEEHARREALALAAEAAAGIGEGAVRSAIDTALSRLNATLADFYGRMIGDSPFTDVTLDFRDKGVGGVEFAFTWDGRHPVTPPQRVMSESQLGALGLSLFLARLKVEPPEWRTMVLDDVVTSFDEVHRTRLVRLLTSEFSDWQILMCTHDNQLMNTVGSETTGWSQLKVASWTAALGPTFGEGTARKRLCEQLDAGQAADELGGLARQAIEQALERPIRKLGLRIRHDPSNTYSPDEYRHALIDGLGEGNFPLADDPVLKRLASDSSVTNRACHFKDRDPSVTAADLRLLLDDLDELDNLFRCPDPDDGCGKAVWELQDAQRRRRQCNCGRLFLDRSA